MEVKVPQGQILGPIIFLLNIKYKDELNTVILFTTYADNTSVIISDKPDTVFAQKCNNTVSTLNSQFNE